MLQREGENKPAKVRSTLRKPPIRDHSNRTALQFATELSQRLEEACVLLRFCLPLTPHGLAKLSRQWCAFLINLVAVLEKGTLANLVCMAAARQW